MQSNSKRLGLKSHLLLRRAQAPLILIAGVITIFWKLVLTSQYTFLEFYDDANQVLPWLQVQVFALRHFTLLLWDPYEWAGQSLVGQLQPGVFSPFTWLLALAPLDRTGHLHLQTVHFWFVLLHIGAALSAYYLFRDLNCRKPAAVVGGLFYGTAGFLGNTPWPQMVESALWAPLVFLFLLRSIRGRAPLRNAALAGLMLGFSWLGGHHGPSLTLTLAACAVSLWSISLHKVHNRQAFLPTAVTFLICGLIAAVQILPSLEYGQHAIRWTATGVKQWNDPIPYTEHDDFALAPPNLLNLIVPGGNTLMGDPFTGVVALTLAALAISTGFRRREVRLFLALSIAALLYSMAHADFLYGILYSLVPFIQRAREPILALSIFQFGVAGLVAFGADSLSELHNLHNLKRALLWFGLLILALFYAYGFVHPTVTSQFVETDPRIGMIALIALLLAAALHTARPSVAIVGFLLLLEQGNETGSLWMHKSAQGAVFLKPLHATQDLADFLHKLPNPKRVEMDRKDIAFNFGDWYRIDTVAQYTPTAPAETLRLNWWQDRMANLYGIDYTIAHAPTRPGQQEIFTGSSGFKIFRNPQAFPRAWTVHNLIQVHNDAQAADQIRDTNLSLKATAVLTDSPPPIAPCAAPDSVLEVIEKPSTVSVSLEMACPGMLIVTDNWYLGWVATVDQKPARLYKVDSTFRGVLVNRGSHHVEMNYRPTTVYIGLACFVCGLVLTAVLSAGGWEHPA